MDRRFTTCFIRGFVKRNNINTDEYENEKYKSFNDFFSRKIKNNLRPFPDDKRNLASPCDAKLTVYQVTSDSAFQIKNSVYSLTGLLLDESLAKEFIDGICLIFRLTPDDYHRYAFIDDGEIIASKRIKGVLHTVRPIAYRHYRIYAQNSREYTVMQTANFGKVIQMEVGALFVGRILNNQVSGKIKRAAEKGMFKFGGSTIIMLFQRDKVTIDEIICKNTQQDKETIVKMGNKIGSK